ncbi:SMI1/KNR4 family protein [Paenibacillus qinlingensis]|uniref:SMI1/KNR4 family protein n=1 Tax=Paenibacillus qinlingensis TaxID=1837343 RepID=UPI0015651C22|nr:SMI1/KNR4 family protein [Paenibacillus qinlingensis]NQX62518.1 SMI1/KNR4 family protein [Paenibacillus qinlingensis]
MKFQIKNTFAPISLENIQEVEQRYGIKLPNDYKEFLLKYNGGNPIPNVMFTTKNGILTSYLVYVHPLFEREMPSLVSNFLYFNKEEKIPSNLIAIGHDPLRNLVCISLAGNDSGFVYYWDFMNDDCDNPSYNHLVLIAKSFSEFIEGLRTD